MRAAAAAADLSRDAAARAAAELDLPADALRPVRLIRSDAARCRRALMLGLALGSRVDGPMAKGVRAARAGTPQSVRENQP